MRELRDMYLPSPKVCARGWGCGTGVQQEKREPERPFLPSTEKKRKSNVQHLLAATTARTDRNNTSVNNPTQTETLHRPPHTILCCTPSPANSRAPPRPTRKTSYFPSCAVHENTSPPTTRPTPSGAFEDTYLSRMQIHHIHEKTERNTQRHKQARSDREREEERRADMADRRGRTRGKP